MGRLVTQLLRVSDKRRHNPLRNHPVAPLLGPASLGQPPPRWQTVLGSLGWATTRLGKGTRRWKRWEGCQLQTELEKSLGGEKGKLRDNKKQ